MISVSRFLQFALFLIVAVSVFAGMHYYFFNRFAFYFEWTKGSRFYIGLWSLIFLFVFSMLLEKTVANGFTRIIYIISSIWLGTLIIGIMVLAIGDLLRIFFHPHPYFAGLLLAAVTLFLSTLALINGQQLKIRHINIELPKLQQNMTLALLSDIHLGTIHREHYMRNIVNLTNQASPDLVCIVGDLFDGSAPVEKTMLAPIIDFAAPVFFTIGNHEVYDGISMVEQSVQDIQLTLLRNELVRFEELQIIGIDNPRREGSQGIPALKSLTIDSSLPSLLLYHSPSGMADAQAAGIDLMLSGHTHWGQIFPFNLATKLIFPNGFGYTKNSSLQTYTGPGTGTWGPPMRLGSRSEITIIHLKALTPETAQSRE